MQTRTEAEILQALSKMNTVVVPNEVVKVGGTKPCLQIMVLEAAKTKLGGRIYGIVSDPTSEYEASGPIKNSKDSVMATVDKVSRTLELIPFEGDKFSQTVAEVEKDCGVKPVETHVGNYSVLPNQHVSFTVAQDVNMDQFTILSLARISVQCSRYCFDKAKQKNPKKPTIDVSVKVVSATIVAKSSIPSVIQTFSQSRLLYNLPLLSPRELLMHEQFEYVRAMSKDDRSKDTSDYRYVVPVFPVGTGYLNLFGRDEGIVCKLTKPISFHYANKEKKVSIKCPLQLQAFPYNNIEQMMAAWNNQPQIPPITFDFVMWDAPPDMKITSIDLFSKFFPMFMTRMTMVFSFVADLYATAANIRDDGPPIIIAKATNRLCNFIGFVTENAIPVSREFAAALSSLRIPSTTTVTVNDQPVVETVVSDQPKSSTLFNMNEMGDAARSGFFNKPEAALYDFYVFPDVTNFDKVSKSAKQLRELKQKSGPVYGDAFLTPGFSADDPSSFAGFEKLSEEHPARRPGAEALVGSDQMLLLYAVDREKFNRDSAAGAAPLMLLPAPKETAKRPIQDGRVEIEEMFDDPTANQPEVGDAKRTRVTNEFDEEI